MEGQSSKQKITVLPPTPENFQVETTKGKPPKKPRFRTVGHVVEAVRRFKANLNPTVDFRKRNRPEDALPTPPSALLNTKKQISEHPELLKRMYTRNASGSLVPRTTRVTRGHKTHYLKRAFMSVEA
eukprot:g7214.t1